MNENSACPTCGTTPHIIVKGDQVEAELRKRIANEGPGAVTFDLVRFPRPTGPFSRRLHALGKIMDKRAASALAASREIPDQNSPAAASLRGKARGYDEAGELIERLERGRRIRGRRWGS